jgi:Golgi apparatus protein 1
MSCLSKSFTKLSKLCSKQIFRLNEMQSADYHLDRALFSACRDDRERFCSQVTSGNGRVYRCLYEQKLNNMMSADVSHSSFYIFRTHKIFLQQICYIKNR